MSELTTLQARVKRLGRIAKWCTALSLILPVGLVAAAVTLFAVAATIFGFLGAAQYVGVVLVVFFAVAIWVFYVLRGGAQTALAEAADVRKVTADLVAPTNGGHRQGKPSVVEKFTRATSRTRAAGTDTFNKAQESLSALLAGIGDSSSHGASHHSHGSSHHDHSSSSHSHSSFDHGSYSHSSFDSGSSFSDGGSSF